MRRVLAVCILTLVAASTLSAQKTQKISTFEFPQQGAVEDDEGAGVIGQVFTVPKNAFKLISFSAYILPGMYPEIMQWNFGIARWLQPFSKHNPDAESQPTLYSTGPFPGVTTPTRFDFYTPGVSVTPTKQYVADFGFWMHPIGAGEIVTMAIANVGDKHSGGGWYTDGSLQPVEGTEADLMFEAEFTVSPEPSTWVLLGSGLIGLGAVAWRRKKQA